MDKIQDKKAARGGSLPPKRKLASPAEQARSDAVERVLEHVTSPFRWELLEVPAVKPKKSIPRKPATQKSEPR